MEEKVSSSNRTRADTADVGNTKITGDEAGRITNMTGTAADKGRSVPAGSTRRNLSVEKRHDANTFTKKLTHEKAGGKLSRSEMQAKTALDRKRIRKEMTAAMTAVGTIKNGAYADSNDNEELSEKVASKGVSLAENVSGKVVDTFQDGVGGLKNTTETVAKLQGGKNVDGSLAGSNAKGNMNTGAGNGKTIGADGNPASKNAVKGTTTKNTSAVGRKPQTDNATLRNHKESIRARTNGKSKPKPRKAAQKRLAKKNYAAKFRKAEKKKSGIVKLLKRLKDLAARHNTTVIVCVVLAVFFLIFFLIMSLQALGLLTVAGEIAGCTFQSDPIEIENAELYMQELEADLQHEIDTMRDTHPGYDEYMTDGGPISHDPIMLIAYFSAKYGIFTFDEVKPEIEELFDLMYEIDYEESEEGPYSTYVPVENEDGSISYDLDSYYITRLTAVITKTELEDLIAGKLNDEQKEHFAVLMDSEGGLQRYAPPTEGWITEIKEPYGWQSSWTEVYRNDGTTYKVIEGTDIQSMCSGTVTAIGNGDHGNYVTVTNEDGYVATVGGLKSVAVSVGQEVEIREPIGTSKWVLYFEVSYDGVYYNPAFFVHRQ